MSERDQPLRLILDLWFSFLELLGGMDIGQEAELRNNSILGKFSPLFPGLSML